MRIFWWVIGSTVGILGIGLAAFFLGERLILQIATIRFEKDITALKQLAYKNSAGTSCGKDYVSSYQLRFINETTYVFETQCHKGGSGKQLSTHTLFGGVRRLYGSGIQINLTGSEAQTTTAWVHLTYRKLVVVSGIFKNSIATKWDSSAYTPGGETPANAQCADWGFMCCNETSEVGEGSQVRTGDCTKACFQACNKRPIILFFNTDPLLDMTSRELLLTESMSTVTFGYEIADYDGSVQSVMIDYGDNQKDTDLPSKSDSISHVYSCLRSSCTYQVQLYASDNHKHSQATSTIATIKIVMRP
jgi:hypothetical protein